MNALIKSFCLVLLLVAGPVLAEPAALDADLLKLQQAWAHVNYEVNGDAQEKAFEDLVKQADALVAGWPQRAEPLIWKGIVLSTYAGAKGGLGALGLVKDAKAVLEQALAIDEKALDGSAHTSLGSLYYQVPGWPIGFGDDDKAEAHLRAALEINPNGIDPNYFFGDYLIEQGKEDRAKAYLERALEAPPRPNREVADAGRRAEIKALLQEVN
ncbi:hypothetical protein RE428_03410 [Marinobacter nanhaiticus D15-8W]|uniref:Tetratricopeptide repeat protein n=1 Tax=Marinobacter nanhaiticus D15-8W TaxID=626887 RepID=N6WTX9_9GAMM|nr:tetratricopeptide repeat protein [Marinobacter nanhaiticus]ENO14981.1 tetratricopeptide repeat protein [Marinobacter nanhaiticus D15-8W]BES69323.1 hypothetical protein RE428_03410 [Marinobacter nanhaiticus D15-8W]